MKKIILSLVTVLALAGLSQAATIGTYSFATGAAVTSKAANLTFSSVVTVGSLVQDAVTPQFRSHGFTKNSSIDTSQYVQFSLNSSIASSFTLSGITFDYRSVNGANNKSGPANARISVFVGSANPLATATPTFSANLSPTTSYQSASITPASPITVNQGQVVTVRFYGWNADPSLTGMLDLDNIQVSGVAPVPEPTNIALAAFGVAFAGVGLGRKFLKKKA